MIERALPLSLCLALAGCVTSGERSPQQAPDRPDLLAQLSAALPGTYGNYAQHHATPEKTAALQMTIERRAADDNSVSLLVEQRRRDGDTAPRRYLWTIRPAPKRSAPAVLEFAPLRNDQPGRSCVMRLQSSRTGVVGSTPRGNCQLQGRSGKTVELRREILVRRDGGIVLGERVHDAQTGAPLSDVQRLEFVPQRSYGGWAGVKSQANANWRIARPITLHDQGDRQTLVDRSGRELGYALELARVRQRHPQPPVLRLAVVDTTDNRQVAYTWAAAGSRFIGLNLGWLQAGLTLGGQPASARQ